MVAMAVEVVVVAVVVVIVPVVIVLVVGLALGFQRQAAIGQSGRGLCLGRLLLYKLGWLMTRWGCSF